MWLVQTVEGVIAEVDTRLQGLQEAGVEQSTRTREKERRSLALVRQEHQEHARQARTRAVVCELQELAPWMGWSAAMGSAYLHCL